MTGFPLFRLPLLPLKNVLGKMYPNDLTMLYLCSEKTQNFLKVAKKSVSIDYLPSERKEKLNVMNKMGLLKLEVQSNSDGPCGCFPKDSVNITITISNRLEIKIDSTYSYKNKFYGCFPLFIGVLPIDSLFVFAGTKSSLKIDGIFVPVEMADKQTMRTFWKNLDNGLNTLVTYLTKFFNTKIKECRIYGSTDLMFSKNLRAAVKGINQRTIDSCEIQNDFNSEDYKFLLDNIKPTIRFKQLNHSGRLITNLQHKTSFNSEYLELNHACWFTLDNLIAADCEHVHLKNSILTNNDMYEYLKLWMDEKFGKLRNLTVELRENVKLAYMFSKLQSYSEIYALVRNGDNIRINRQNETVATISCINEYLSRKKFAFFVYHN